MIITKPTKKPISGDAAVGLGIVAAMIKTPSVLSNPIPAVPIRNTSINTTNIVFHEEEEEEEESFSCHVRKRVCFDHGDEGEEDDTCGIGVFFEPTSPPPLMPKMEVWGVFLSCCYLCRKSLHGLDVFMYRGEKAFCSEECRNQQITSDEYQEKLMVENNSENNNNKKKKSSLSCSVSPSRLSHFLLYVSGLAAA